MTCQIDPGRQMGSWVVGRTCGGPSGDARAAQLAEYLMARSIHVRYCKCRILVLLVMVMVMVMVLFIINQLNKILSIDLYC